MRKLRVYQAIEPVNINWENLDVSKYEQIMRSIAFIFIMVIIVFITFLFVLYVSSLSKKGTNSMYCQEAYFWIGFDAKNITTEYLTEFERLTFGEYEEWGYEFFAVSEMEYVEGVKHCAC